MKPNTYIPALTGVRAIAAFLVFFHHFNQQVFPYWLFRIFNEFHCGVTVFFVLSGFLIGLRYYETCEISGEWFRKYIKNRIARIYPMYLLLTLATFVLAWITKDFTCFGGFPYSTLLLFLNIFFLRGFFDDLKFTGVGQGWSLTVEECFYFLAPFFFIKIKKNIRFLLWLPLMLIATGMILVFICSRFSFYGLFGNYTFMFLYTFLGRCTEFFIGIALAIIILRSKENSRSNIPKFTLIGVAGIILGIGIMAILPLTETRKFGLYHPLGIISNNLILPLGIAFFFYGIIKEKTRIQHFLSTPSMELLGKSSYIFYLIHIGFISVFVSKWSGWGIEKLYDWLDEKEIVWVAHYIPSSLLLILLVFIILNMISIILYKFIEEPLNHFIRKSSLLQKK